MAHSSSSHSSRPQLHTTCVRRGPQRRRQVGRVGRGPCGCSCGAGQDAVSASPLVLPGLDGTRPSAPDPGSPPSIPLRLAFDTTQVLWDLLEASTGPGSGPCPAGTTVWRKQNREQVAKCQVALCSCTECPEVEGDHYSGCTGERIRFRTRADKAFVQRTPAEP